MAPVSPETDGRAKVDGDDRFGGDAIRDALFLKIIRSPTAPTVLGDVDGFVAGSLA